MRTGGRKADELRPLTFSREQLDRLLKLGKVGIDAITAKQRRALGTNWPLD